MTTHASVFSGIGAPEIAAKMLGWKNLFHCEINPFGRKILDYYFPKSKSYNDITKTDFSEWNGRVTVLSGGFPCQPFSTAGKRKGSEDERYIWPYMLKCIEQVRPTWFVGENVVGITTMVLTDEEVIVGQETNIFGESNPIYKRRQRYIVNEICENLDRIGYTVQPFVIPAASVGACHRRYRVFFVAHDGRMGGGNSQQDNVEDSLCMGLQTTKELADFERQRDDRTASDERPFEASTEFRVQWRGDGWLPSQPLTIRGNDGLPFDVDDLSIPFEQWREESSKAFGNAIVPQVIYEIYSSIDKIHNVISQHQNA